MACPSCGAAVSEVAPYPDGSPPFAGLSVALCAACGLAHAQPMPGQPALDAYYQASYWNGGVTNVNVHTRAYYHAQSLARIDFIGGTAGLRSVLDVGAGSGDLAGALRARGFSGRYCAVEPDERQAKELGAFRSLEEAGGGYDLIVLSHVLEHVPSPEGILAAVMGRLVPGGRLFVELPNRDDLYKEVLEPHVLFFSPETLRAVLSRHADILKLETCGRAVADLRASPERKPSGLKALVPAPLKTALKKLLGRGKPQPAEEIRRTLCLDAYGGERQWLRALAAKRAS